MMLFRTAVSLFVLTVGLAFSAAPVFAHGGSAGDTPTYAMPVPQEHDLSSL